MSRPRLLVVGDDPDIRDIMELNFMMEGFDVLTAANGREADEIVRSQHPDAVVLDIMMPERDGIDVLTSLRADPATHDIPVVLLSAKATNGEVLDGWRAGAAGYTTKPFDPEELVRYVSHLVSPDYLCS
jgi:DNA-binding response OmpR family regulator